MAWDPKRDDDRDTGRDRPVSDLLAALSALHPRTIVVLRCGDGHLARRLAATWPEAAVLGVDPCEAMLRWAAATPSRVRYEQAALADWRPAHPVDLIVCDGGPADPGEHPRLLPELLQRLAPGGTLALVLPRTEEEAPYRLLLQAARRDPWAERLEGLLRPAPAHAPGDYYDWLRPLAARIELWQAEYLTPVSADIPLQQRVNPDMLAPVMEALSGTALDRFLADYARRLEEAFPQRCDGTVLMPSRRLFVVARIAG
ncbi:methyltransferase domain-containing protein [Azospirillum thermophilum]|uniref:Trans-aconitate 2-methyltransferase n=1 Tax=Azospirillum thermophilum TaxID=2202148 RepID=A0A2S2CSK2_9PROT|nr:methyltransferase domain-containing protein [Azospirillum thermophilum]AWK87449.1 trans-aconitate 2-methyltransferase [Azospirillum thermophilum]